MNSVYLDDYLELCKKVGTIDKDAENYMRSLLSGDVVNCTFALYKDLDGIFIWDTTPQGYGYWSDLYEKMERYPKMIEDFKELFRCTREYTLLNEKYSDEKIFNGLENGLGFSGVYSAYQVYTMTLEQINIG